jgi:hypothetical protein
MVDNKRLKELYKKEQSYDILKAAHDQYREAAFSANHYILQHEINKLNYSKQLDKVLSFIESKRGILDSATLSCISAYVLTLEKEKQDNGYCNSSTYYKSL